MDMVAPVCPRIFGCTAYEASIHQHAVRVIFAECKAHVDGVTQIGNQPRDLFKVIIIRAIQPATQERNGCPDVWAPSLAEV